MDPAPVAGCAPHLEGVTRSVQGMDELTGIGARQRKRREKARDGRRVLRVPAV